MNAEPRGEDKDHTRRMGYSAARSVGIVACIFSLVVCILVFVNFLRLRAAAPADAPAFQRLLADLRERESDPALIEDVRTLDLLTRKAYFTSRQFARTGAWLLLGGVAVMLAAFAVMKSLSRTPPDPRRLRPPDQIPSRDGLARWLVASVGLALVTVAIAVTAGPRGALKPFPETGGTEPEDTTAQRAAAGAGPTREEFLANWPCFRGPGGLGLAHSPAAPTDWDGAASRGILWKVSVPKPGFSSPIVWDTKVFLTGADGDGQEVYCFDAENGAVLWRRAVAGIEGSPAAPPGVSDDTGLAAPTMATDGRRVFALFATGDLACFDFEGDRLWAKNLGVPENPYGHASSLITYEGLLLVQFDDDEDANVLALNAATGQTVWTAPREVYASWTSPIIVEIGARAHLVTSASPFLISYDPATGAELIKVECVSGEVAPSPAYASGIIFVASEYGYLAGVDADLKKVAWETFEDLADVSSPLAAGNLMWLAASDGTVTCFEGATGNVVWQHEFDEGFYASPILVGDLIYLLDKAGVMRIMRAGTEFELTGSPALGERSDCTPALVGGRIYIRGEKHLFCLGAADD